MSKRMHGRHRAPSRLDNAVVASARATAVLAATGGIATLATPANAAPADGSAGHQAVSQDQQVVTVPAVTDPTLTKPVAELSTTASDINTMSFAASTGALQIMDAEIAPAAAPAAQVQVSRSDERTALRNSPAANSRREAPIAAPTARPVAAPVAKKAKPAILPAKKKADPAPSFGAGGSAIVAAAMAQLGVSQDCVSLATNAVSRAGYKGMTIYTPLSGYGPMYGYAVSNPQPGDIVYYLDVRHVAIYIGNGMAVHGGYRTKWGGKTTKIDKVSISPGRVTYHRLG